MNPPTVTIIIPCYNVGKFLRECLESVLRQTVANIHAIAVDDCSTDDTAEIIREFQKRDSRIEGIFHTENAGVSVARNDGIERVDPASPWIMFVDGDDFLPDNAVEILLKVQRTTNAELVCANSREYDADGRVPGAWCYPQAPGLARLQITEDLMEFINHQRAFCNSCNKLFPTSVIKQNHLLFNTQLRHAQDCLFTHEFLLRFRPSIAVDYNCNVYCYRQHNASCVHAIPLDKRLRNLTVLLTELEKLANELHYSRRLLVRKAAEYLWAIRKFSADRNEPRKYLVEVSDTPLFQNLILPVLMEYGKRKHRLLARLLSWRQFWAIRYW